MIKLKWHVMTAVATLVIGAVAGHSMSGSVAREEARRVATSVAPFDMMIAARNLPDQVIDTPF